ncbi:hypothetical protein GGH19_000653 [Coemansia sp. RSA 1807]|nr:hypothetical protein LPJ62_003265 [Coemansia sp. RSA 2167]KAJ2133161.1 hypothetical protein GGF48_000391 [Coemansia sp. RSA 921]KAJ2141542.1 hypothetical protein J3F82_005504 [Coemansia sp. RSA 637]KAJ2146495.1 hypothetical protein IW142_002074 [Coemansia sp. RSA 564]KAJ2281808.1 hypothetical protein EV176_000235 [Coemansia sp. RSA 451]KAJ2533934.1 hypothetical protein GGH20_000339 [Coemansia sp. RSA 1937]KAJ2550117.1 hypothetical protein IWW35_003443 [Coemansia sp. RSA 1878]KAJ2578249.1 
MPDAAIEQVTLYLIRHGETEVNRRNCVQGKRIDPPLNERGRRQAECVGRQFQDIKVDWIVTSAAQRAIETGSAVSTHHPGVPLDSFPALNELEFGDLEGRHVTTGYNDLVVKWDTDHCADLTAPGAGSESPTACAQRAMPCIQDIVEIAAAKGWRHVCIVAHSRLIQIVLAAMLDGSLQTMGKYKQKKAAINTIKVSAVGDAAGQWGVSAVALKVNSVEHMPNGVLSRVSSAGAMANRSQKDELVCFEVDSRGVLVLRYLSASPH